MTTSILDATQQLDEKEAARLVYWFTLPDKLAAESGIKKLGFRENKASEELMATDRARGDQVRLSFELVKQSLRYVNETKVNMGDGSLERFWGRDNPATSKVRQLCLAAYAKVHNPAPQDAEDFLDSMTMEAG